MRSGSRDVDAHTPPWLAAGPAMRKLDCDVLVAYAGPRLTPSPVVQRGRDAGPLHRTSYQTLHQFGEDPQADRVVSALHAFCRHATVRPSAELEGPYIIRYREGEYFGSHTDGYSGTGTPSKTRRTHSIVVCLQEPIAGGHLRFPRVDIELAPALGSAAVFENFIEGQRNSESLHESTPVEGGEKWVAVVFVLSTDVSNGYRLPPHLCLFPIPRLGGALAANLEPGGGLRVLSSAQAHLALRATDPNARALDPIAARAARALRNWGVLVDDEQQFGVPALRLSRPKRRVLNLWVHASNGCNLACTYCYIEKEQGAHMSEGTIEHLFDAIVRTSNERGLDQVVLRLAGGEPMFRWQVWKKMLPRLRRALEPAGCELYVTFLTNLTIMSSELCNWLLDDNVGVSVSLDGMGAGHSAARPFRKAPRDGRTSFDTTFDNLRYVIERGVRPYLMVVVSQASLGSLAELTRFIVKHDLRFRYSFVKGQAIDMVALESTMIECYDILEEAVTTGFRFTDGHRLCDLNLERFGQQVCGAGSTSGAVFVDGSLHFCQLNVTDGDTSLMVGDAEDLLEAIATRHYMHGSLHEDCRHCAYKNVCGGGCPQARADGGKTPYCAVFKALLPRIFGIVGLERVVRQRGAAMVGIESDSKLTE